MLNDSMIKFGLQVKGYTLSNSSYLFSFKVMRKPIPHHPMSIQIIDSEGMWKLNSYKFS